MKEKRRMKKFMITTMLVTTGILVMGGTSSQAALQANSSTHANPATKTGAQFIEQIRKMEATGETMGLNEDDINTDLSPKTSNGIDIHMMRTTEYGAMAILSVSGFGNPKKLSEVSIKTTTGNATGVYLTGDRREWTAGVSSESTVGKNARYYDLYTTSNTSAKVGDALGTADTVNKGCTGWHGSGISNWLTGTAYGFVRGYRGVFSFHGMPDTSINGGWAGGSAWHDDNYEHYGRGVAVVQSGV